MEHALMGIETLVAHVKEVRLEVPTDRTLQAAESYAYHAEDVAKHPEMYQPETLRRIRTGEKVTAAEYMQRRRELEFARRNIRRRICRGRCAGHAHDSDTGALDFRVER